MVEQTGRSFHERGGLMALNGGDRLEVVYFVGGGVALAPRLTNFSINLRLWDAHVDRPIRAKVAQGHGKCDRSG